MVWFVAAFGAVAQDNVLHILIVMVALYWVPQVIKNVVHLTAAGATASWYFSSVEHNAVGASFRRATTKSFGTVCFGSLVVAVLQAVHTIGNVVNKSGLATKQNGKQNGGPAACALLLCGMCAQHVARLMTMVNQYAYTYVAIYGYPMVQASRETYKLVRQVGLLPLMRNNLLQSVIMVGASLSGLMCVLVGFLFHVFSPTIRNLAPDYTWAIYLLCFTIGYIMTLPLLEIVQSTVCALFVCFATEPDVLEAAKPELFTNITDSYEMMTGGRSFQEARAGGVGGGSGSDYEYDYEYEEAGGGGGGASPKRVGKKSP